MYAPRCSRYFVEWNGLDGSWGGERIGNVVAVGRNII